MDTSQSIAHGRAVADIVAQRQHERLTRAQRCSHDTPARPSPWQHVPLVDFFANDNTIYSRSDGRLECGHEPHHGSKSARCVLVDPSTGRWYCRSCRRGGDAASFVMALNGWSYRQAAEWLTTQYGAAPTDSRRRRRPQPQRRGRLRWRAL
jgi:DNA primase